LKFLCYEIITKAFEMGNHPKGFQVFYSTITLTTKQYKNQCRLDLAAMEKLQTRNN